MGGVGGSLSYLAGSRIADVSFPYGQTPTLILLAVIWAGVLPLLHSFARMYREKSAAH
jgi:hypothetical protein